MSSDVAILIQDLSKCYHVYDVPRDRLKQFILPRLQRLMGMEQQKYFQEFWALDGVSLAVKRGETLGVVGRNGSGKSTLLQLICGTLTPSCGTVKVSGRISALLELGAGFNPEFTGRENVYMNAAVLGLQRDEVNELFSSIEAFAEIGSFIEQPVKFYSSGMVVRLAFAVAIHVSPDILVVDEALSVGDERFQRKCFAKVEALKKSGTTIIFVSHSATSVVEFCDRVLLLDSGHQIQIGDAMSTVALYQKILYSSEETRSGLIAGEQLDNNQCLSPVSEQTSQLPEGEYYDELMVPTSTVSFDSRGVEISNPHILNGQRQRVNFLVSGRRYKFCYDVFFRESGAMVTFGMMIKTKSGVTLGALSSVAREDAITFIEKGKRVHVEYEFENRFLPGVYFLNAGCRGVVEGEETVLHRILDVAMFRVEHYPSKREFAGYIDIGSEFTCETSVL